MSNETNELKICPWCDTEFIWDPEIGPENQCPYCENELSDYRSVFVNLVDEDEELLENQDESLVEHANPIICYHCLEQLVHIGNESYTANQFKFTSIAYSTELKLSQPFELEVYLCLQCYRVEKYLPEKNRNSLK
jgi:hypothetical protein